MPAWLFLATSGCRRGKCLGLRWSDIDLDQATAVISRQVVTVQQQVIVKEFPKTKTPLKIHLDTGTVTMLRRLRAEHAERRLRLGRGQHDDHYVLHTRDSTDAE